MARTGPRHCGKGPAAVELCALRQSTARPMEPEGGSESVSLRPRGPWPGGAAHAAAEAPVRTAGVQQRRSRTSTTPGLTTESRQEGSRRGSHCLGSLAAWRPGGGRLRCSAALRQPMVCIFGSSEPRGNARPTATPRGRGVGNLTLRTGASCTTCQTLTSTVVLALHGRRCYSTTG